MRFAQDGRIENKMPCVHSFLAGRLLLRSYRVSSTCFFHAATGSGQSTNRPSGNFRVMSGIPMPVRLVSITQIVARHFLSDRYISSERADARARARFCALLKINS